MILTDRDIAIIGFLWRWKLASTSAIYAKYFPDVNPLVPYRRLRELECAGYLSCQMLSYQNSIWSISKKGFNVIRPKLPSLKEEGFKSEKINHDILVTALHLGEWLVKRPADIEMCSEQELRRFHPDTLPGWIPKTEIHRPDGYWYLKAQPKPQIIALEVELSRKTKAELESLSAFYRSEESIAKVLWMVCEQSHAESIERTMNQKSDRRDLHQFILESDFRATGWDSKIIVGSNKNISIHSLLKADRTADVTNGLQSYSPRFIPALLDLRKRRVLPQTSL
jgi:hypothetical protein